jgi:hypothetical protein
LKTSLLLIDDEISLRTTKKIQEMHNAATKLLPKLEGGGGYKEADVPVAITIQAFQEKSIALTLYHI